MQKPVNLILSILLCILACQTQTRSVVRRALTNVNPLKLTKPLARPVNWVTQTQFYKKHPWLVKTGALIATGLLAKKAYTAYNTRKRSRQNQLNNALVKAVQDRNRNQVEKLLQQGANINVRRDAEANYGNHEDLTLIHLAIMNNDLAMVKKLIAAKIDLNVFKHGAGTPLTQACNYNYTHIALEIIHAGAQINSRGSFRKTALMEACFRENKVLVDALLAQGADVHATDWNGQTALSETVTNKSNNIIRTLIEAGARGNVYTIARGGKKPLLEYAIEDNNLERTMLLLSAGADINSGNSIGETALIGACFKNRTEIAQALIRAGADVNAQCTVGITPLMHAVKNKNAVLVDALIAAGANMYQKSNGAFLYAILGWDRAMMKTLIDTSTQMFDENYYRIFDEQVIAKAFKIIHETENTDNDDRFNIAPKITSAMKKWIDEQHQLAREKMDAHLQTTTLPDPLRTLVAEYATGAPAVPAAPAEQV